jgi:hypothetical protein
MNDKSELCQLVTWGYHFRWPSSHSSAGKASAPRTRQIFSDLHEYILHWYDMLPCFDDTRQPMSQLEEAVTLHIGRKGRSRIQENDPSPPEEGLDVQVRQKLEL